MTKGVLSFEFGY